MRSLTKALLGTAALAAALSLAPARAAAQESQTNRCEEENADDGSGGKKKNWRTVRGPDGRKIIVIEKGFTVCGKVPKPQVFYVLHQRNINYEWENLKQDFLPKITNSVKKDPF